jgi:hypothetical protein
MAIIDGLTTLAAVKLDLGITDTTQDALLESLISAASAAIVIYVDRTLKRTTYTDQRYAVNAHQYLYLREYPIQSVSSVTLGGSAQTVDVDYFIDAAPGRLYRPYGWVGAYYSRGTFPDAFAGARDILITYVAGWYLPADLGYVAGAADSLPLLLSDACQKAVTTRFNQLKNRADGIKQYAEGDISTTWFDETGTLAGAAGFDSITVAMLAPFKRREAV